MDLANKTVSLYQSAKIEGKWTFKKISEIRLGRLSKGGYYISWYSESGKQLEPVGPEPDVALAALTRKRAELGYVAAGGKIEPAENGSEDDKRTKVTAAIAEYFADCRDRQGKSGYGLSVRTVEAYEGRLARLVEIQPGACLDQINGEFIRKFRRFLREHPDDLSDRSCYNIMQAVSTFLTRNNILVARPFLKEMSYPPTEVITYTDVELATFFVACDEKEKLLFKFFLHSMARDMEVAHTEVRDLYFQKNVLHISPKPDRDRQQPMKENASREDDTGCILCYYHIRII